MSPPPPPPSVGSKPLPSAHTPLYDPAFGSAGTSLESLDHDLESSRGYTSARAALPQLVNPSDPMALTPLRAHYLKKTLLKLQVEREIAQLSTKDALATFGPPFKPSAIARRTDLPLLRFMFQHFVLTFPFLRSAPPNFFSDKVQVFADRFFEKNISSTDDRTESTKRRRLANKMEKYFVLLMGAAIHVKGVGEEVVKIGDRDRKKMAVMEARRKAALGGVVPSPHDSRPGSSSSHHSHNQLTSFDINVISVRNVVTRGRIRNRVHEEFIIRTRRVTPGSAPTDVYVSRRYGDFARLADTLRVEFPDEDIRAPPPKDRNTTDIADPFRRNQADQLADPNGPSTSNDGSHVALPTGPLAREKNRLTLRAYLRSLLAIPPIADSAIFMDFLTGDPTRLTPSEEEDAAIREGLDHVRDEEQRHFAEEASRRVAELQSHIASFKADLVQKDGLTRIFATIKSTPKIEDLPEKYRALIKWARISLASTIFHVFMGSDTSSDIFSQLKRMHGLMPYFVLRGILRVSNPVAMIRGVIDLFLAQPFGQRSLLQRMFSSSLQDDVKEISEVCQAVSEKVDDPVLCEKVRAFVYAPPEIQQVYRDDAEAERLDILTTILRSPEAPALNRAQIHRVVMASRAYEVYKEYRRGLKNPEIEDEGPQDEDAWLYEDLHVLMKMLTRQRDKEQMIALIFDGVTSELLKDMVTIFYSPLAQVYKLANIADSLSDLQVFINDLIKTVESSEELSYTDPQKTVQVFIDLVERHEAKFYNFVHQVHSKGSGLFDGLMHWIELFINFVRGGEGAPSTSPAATAARASSSSNPSSSQVSGTIDDPLPELFSGLSTKPSSSNNAGIGEIDLEVCMPAGGEERKKALEEIDSLVLHAYRLKFLRELKLRRRLADKEVAGAANKLIGTSWERGEDDDQAFVGAIIDNLGVGDMFSGEVADAEAEESEEESEEEADRDDEDHPFHGEGSRVKGSSETETETDGELDDGKGDEEEDVLDLDPSAPQGARVGGSRRWVPSPLRQNTLRPWEDGSKTPTTEKDLPSLPPQHDEARQSSGGQGGGGGGDTEAESKRRKKSRTNPQPPQLKVIPEMVPLFVEMVRPLLRPARTASASSFASPNDPFLQQMNQRGNGDGGGVGGGNVNPSSPASSIQPHDLTGSQQNTAPPGGYRW
ncbi:hypothetical protein IE53DRAFT_410573 [Violaceomyces palustris]|uniref:Uncharacterized protein n=1 Tax=Violaceomyces palustris TaxID=1673888 RepID=A0ACD0NYP3_9BASI|nr:hypothetical protein IE53DRAFT_410573 [Violaceomyces palustris]